MKIKSITLNNIRSYENQKVEFPDGSVVLSGDIGCGKTSILLGIEFALFGLQPGQRGSGLLRNGKDEGKVILEIEIDGKTMKIERTLKRGKTITQSEARIEIDNEKYELSVTELKNKVLELLNYPKEFAKKTNLLYRFTVYTPQEEMKQIILENAETRLDTLRHIFGIDKYKRVKENASVFITYLRENIRNLEGQIKDLEQLNKKLIEKKSSIANIDINLEVISKELEIRIAERKKAEEEILEVDSKIKEKEKYEKEIEKTRIMVLGKKEIISRIESEKITILKQLDELKKTSFDYTKILEEESLLKQKEKEYEEKNKIYIDFLTKQRSENSKALELEKLKSQIKILVLCPTCLQNVPEDYKSNILRKFQEDIEKIKRENEIVNTEKNSIFVALENMKKDIENIKKNIENMKMIKIRLDSMKDKEVRLSLIEKQEEDAKKDIDILDNQIITLKESVAFLKKFDSIYEQKNSEVKDKNKKEKEKEIELATMKREKEFTLKIITEIEQEITDKEKIKQKLNFTTEVEQWLDSSFLTIVSLTEKNIMLKLREDFSKLFNEWFNVLVPENFSVRLDEDFTPIIEQQEYQLDYSFMSGGERTAIALAYRLALNQIINSLLSKIKTRDLIILDEPTDGFSEQQLDKMRDVLEQLNVSQLVIVSHEPKIESFVENIIKFKKENGITKVN